MASQIIFISSGLIIVFLTFLVHSIPIEIKKENIQKENVIEKLLQTSTMSTSTISQSSSTTTTTTTKTNEQKMKRFIPDDQLDGLLDNESEESEEIDHALHTNIRETSAQLHDKTDKLIDSDDSQRFSDIHMTPNELTDIVRKRRDVKINDESTRRRKRALLPYDLYDTDSFYDSYADLIERPQYVRPIRSFAPLYWYPDVYERNVRSALPPSFYESSDYPRLYSSIDNSEVYDDNNELFDDNENDYEINRYPILVKSSDSPFYNQQEYNIDDLPIDEELQFDSNDDDDDDDDDEDDEQYGLPYLNDRSSIIRY